MRLIDADALIEIITARMGYQLEHAKNSPYVNCARDMMKLVKHAPTIEAEPVWISVKDRLPNDGQDVLAYLYNGEETRIAPCNYDKGTWYDCVMNCTVAINSITHWMPLPELP